MVWEGNRFNRESKETLWLLPHVWFSHGLTFRFPHVGPEIPIPIDVPVNTLLFSMREPPTVAVQGRNLIRGGFFQPTDFNVYYVTRPARSPDDNTGASGFALTAVCNPAANLFE